MKLNKRKHKVLNRLTPHTRTDWWQLARKPALQKRTWRFSYTSSWTRASSVPTWQRSTGKWAVLAEVQTANQEKGIFPSIKQLWHCSSSTVSSWGFPSTKTSLMSWSESSSTQPERAEAGAEAGAWHTRTGWGSWVCPAWKEKTGRVLLLSANT